MLQYSNRDYRKNVENYHENSFNTVPVIDGT